MLPSHTLYHWGSVAGRGGPGALGWPPPSFRVLLLLTLKLSGLILLRKVEFSYSQSKLEPF